MKKIAFFISRLGGGGAEGVCVTLANGLADRGLDIELIILSIEGGIRINELSYKVSLIELKKKRVYFAIFSIWRYLVISKPDVVLSFNSLLSVVIGVIRYLSRIHFKLISRNIDFLSIKLKHNKSLGFWRGVIPNLLIRIFYPLSDIFIAQCKGMRDDLTAYYKVDPNKIIVINNPVNKKMESYLNSNVQSTNNKKKGYLLCIGRLEYQKAFDCAIKAFSQIAQDYPLLRLKILGQGILEAQLKYLVSDLGITDKVDFEGYQEDVIPYYVHAKLTVLTSLHEGFPNVLIESISLGTPVVSFDCPSGPNEIIQDGVNGYLARYQDMEHLIECLKATLEQQWNPEIVQASAERFSSQIILDEYEKVLLL